MARLSEFKVLSFDCYGTLIDWETGILEALCPLARRAGTDVGDDFLLETFGRLEEAQERATPRMIYSDVLRLVHRDLGRELGVATTDAEDGDFASSVGTWAPFPDSVDALGYLQKHFRLAILSNVDHRSFAGSRRQLQTNFDFVFTAEDIGSYKPDLRNFAYLEERLGDAGFVRSEILHVAQSLFHDHVPANRRGLSSAWIDRRHQKSGSGATVRAFQMPEYDFYFVSLAELAQAHAAELAETDCSRRG